MTEKVTLRFEVPGPDTPGYLRRVHQALGFMNDLNSKNPSPEAVERMVDFLSQYVVEPADKEQAVEALWMASENEFRMLLSSVAGEAEEGAENPTG